MQLTRVQKCTNTIERGRTYHKSVAVIFAPQLLQIGNDQWPHTDDVGDSIQKKRHTQVSSQDGLSQSGARRHPISCLSALQPIDYKFRYGKPVRTTEHTGGCSLPAAFEQAKITTWVVN